MTLLATLILGPVLYLGLLYFAERFGIAKLGVSIFLICNALLLFR